MTFPNQKFAADAPASPTEHSQTRPHSSFGLKIFVGPNGLRAGWRLLIFAVLVVVLLGGFLLVRNGGVQGFMDAKRHAAEITVTPLLMLGSEGAAFLLICIATLIMGKIEHRKFSEYGLPLRRALGKEFWVGCSSGFLAIGGTLLAMFLFGGFRITGFALHGTAILASGVGWGVAFFVVG